MPNSLRCKVKNLCHKGILNEKDRDRLINGLDCADALQEIRAELTKSYVDPYNRNAFRYTTVSLLEVLDLIDKHLKEYEGSEKE